MNIPVYQPAKVNEATLTPETFGAIYSNLTELTTLEGSDHFKVGDLDEKALHGHPNQRVGRKFSLEITEGLVVPERITAMALDDRGIELVGEATDDDTPGHPIGYLNFAKDGDEGTLNGWLQLLDSGAVSVDVEWRLDQSRSYLRSEFVQFAGKVGLDNLLFKRGARLHQTLIVPHSRFYLREGDGRRIKTALKRLGDSQPEK